MDTSYLAPDATDYKSYESFTSVSAMARRIRCSTVEMIHCSGGGHYGGSLSVVDVLVVLFSYFLCEKHKDVAGGDRFVLSKGHAAPAYYATLAEYGVIEKQLLDTYAVMGSVLQGHPDMVVEPTVDFSTGSLGQGLSAALGMAIMLRERAEFAWVVLGDGECQEGQVWEAAMLASRMRLGNLTAVVDANRFQEWGFRREGRVEEPIENIEDKWRSFGWTVVSCNGHDYRALKDALAFVKNDLDRPGVVIARTTKGRGSKFIESNPDRFHCGNLSEVEFKAVLEEIRDEAVGDPLR